MDPLNNVELVSIDFARAQFNTQLLDQFTLIGLG